MFVLDVPVAFKLSGKRTVLTIKEQKSFRSFGSLLIVIPSPIVVFDTMVSRMSIDAWPLVISIPLITFPVNKLSDMVNKLSNFSIFAPITHSLTQIFRREGAASLDFIPWVL